MPNEQTITIRSPRLRCYKCGYPEIYAVCHHCHRPMCQQHTASSMGLSLFQENREFLKLGLESRPTQSTSGAHCAEHAAGENHPIPNYRRIMVYPGILVALLALFYAFSALRAGVSCLQNPPQPYTPGIGAAAEVLRDPATRTTLPPPACYQPELFSTLWRLAGWSALLSLSLVTIGYGVLLDQDKYQAQLHGRLPIPLTPRSRGIIARETLTGQIELTPNGQYQEKLVQHVGVLDPRLEFTTLDRQRLQLYESKYKVSVAEESFTAGYLHLLGAPHIWLQEGAEPQARLLPLTGLVQDHPYLLNQRGRSQKSWDRRWEYTVLANGTDNSAKEWAILPVQLVLNRQQHGNGQRLGLIVQLPELLNEAPALSRLTIQKLVLYTPDSLPKPERVYPHAAILPDEREGQSGFKIVWQNINFLTDADNRFLPQHHLWLEFPHLSAEQAVLTGELSLLLESAPSGITQAHLYSPLGYRLYWHEEDESHLPLAAYNPSPRQRRSRLQRLWDWSTRQFSQGSSVIMENLSRDKEPAEETEIEPEANKVSLYELFNDPALSRRTLKPGQHTGEQDKDEVQDALPVHSQLAVQVAFSLALTDLVYHERYGKQEVLLLPGMRPTHEMVHRLVEAITLPDSIPDPNFHIRAVIENMPQLSQRQGQLNKHLWDINGRYYHKIFPLDFHLVISGTAARNGAANEGDMAQVEIVVQAHVSHPDFKKKVDQVSQELQERLEAALKPAQERKR